MSVFNSNWKQRIGVVNAHFYARKEGPTLKPSSQKLGTCQSQNLFALGPLNPITKTAYLNVCEPYMNPVSTGTFKKHLRNCCNLIRPFEASKITHCTRDFGHAMPMF